MMAGRPLTAAQSRQYKGCDGPDSSLRAAKSPNPPRRTRAHPAIPANPLRRARSSASRRLVAHWAAMSDSSVLDLIQLRRGCTYCSVRQLCLPGGIDAEELRRLDQIVQRRRPVARGERLFRLGDPMTAVFVARDGAFKSVSISEDGDEHVLGFHLPGELIGLDALGSGHHRCEGVALTASNVCEVPYDLLSEVAAQVPSLQQQLFRVIGQSTDRDQDHLDMLMRRQANERIALFLHSLGERYLIAGHSDRQYTLPMSREDIARFLGLALETVSRGFTRLQDDGVIAVTGRRIEILKAAELLDLAHGAESSGDGKQRRA
jgi:CRP/FNR family transcriptional regulator